MSHERLAPLSPKRSRSTSSNRACAGTVSVTGCPLTVMAHSSDAGASGSGTALSPGRGGDRSGRRRPGDVARVREDVEDGDLVHDRGEGPGDASRRADV